MAEAAAEPPSAKSASVPAADAGCGDFDDLKPEGRVWKEYIGKEWRKLDEAPVIVWITSGRFVELTIIFSRKNHEDFPLQALLMHPPRMRIERVIYFAFPINVVQMLLSWASPLVGKSDEEKARLENYAKPAGYLIDTIKRSLAATHPPASRQKFLSITREDALRAAQEQMEAN